MAITRKTETGERRVLIVPEIERVANVIDAPLHYDAHIVAVIIFIADEDASRDISGRL